MTKEEFEILKNYESYFHSAIHAQYIRCLQKKDVEILHNYYQQFFNKKKNNLNCSSCVYDMVKDLGILYYEHLKTEYNGKKKRNKGNNSNLQ